MRDWFTSSAVKVTTFLVGVIGDLEHEVLQRELAELGVTQQLGARAERHDVVASPPGACLNVDVLGTTIEIQAWALRV